MAKKLFLFASFFLLLILIPSVFALALSPPKYNFDYVPGETHDVSFNIYGEPNKTMRAVVSGPTTDNIILSETEFVLDNQGQYTLHATFTVPELSKPGPYEWKITIEDAQPISGAGTVVATVAMSLPIRIRVPYPEKYAEIKLGISNVKSGEPAHFSVELFNYGSELISSASGNIEVLDATNTTVTTLSLPAVNSIEPEQKEELTADWDTIGIKLGEYTAKASVNYDGNIANDYKSFKIGDILIEVFNITKKEVQRNTIAKIPIIVESKWSDPIDNVYATLHITKEGETVSDITTAAEKVDPWDKQTLIAYWDTNGLDTGTYDAQIIINYENKTTEYNTQFKVVSPNMFGSMNVENLAILLLLIFIILVGIAYYRKKRKRAYWYTSY